MAKTSIRTTITLPEELHQELREEAFRYHKSLNEVILARLAENPEKKYSTKSIEQEIEEDWAFFQKIAKMGQQIDPVQAVREERDRDNA